MLRSGLRGPRLNRSITSGYELTGSLPRHLLKIQGYWASAPVRGLGVARSVGDGTGMTASRFAASPCPMPRTRLRQERLGTLQGVSGLSHQPLHDLPSRDDVVHQPCTLAGKGQQLVDPPLLQSRQYLPPQAVCLASGVVAPLLPGVDERRA